MKQGKKNVTQSLAESWSDDELMGFAYDEERFDAELIAGLYQSGRVKAASEYLARIGNWSHTLPLLLNELNGKRRTVLSQKRLNIVRAYIAACPDEVATPTLFAVKLEYARLFVKEQRAQKVRARRWLRDLEERNEIPRERTFRETLKRCRLRLRADQWGAPTHK
jgi:hypothetical protein